MDKAQELAAKGYSILFSTHNPEMALMCSERIALLEDGRISKEGRKDGFLDGKDLSRMYGRDLFVENVDTGCNIRTICIPR